MMRALIFGGMVGNYYAPIDAILAQPKKLKRADYDPNPYGFFESGFIPAIEAHGMVTNIMLPQITVGFKDPLMAVVMHRPEAERAASLDEWAFDTDSLLYGFPAYYQRFCEMHPHATIADVDYSALVADPDRELTTLALAGWPIDVQAAIPAIDPALYRHRAQ